MNSRISLFIKRWWYPLSIFPWFAAFMTPGMTMLAFIGFVFFSGVAARPKLEQLIEYATGSATEDFNAHAIPAVRKQARKRTSRKPSIEG